MLDITKRLHVHDPKATAVETGEELPKLLPDLFIVVRDFQHTWTKDIPDEKAYFENALKLEDEPQMTANTVRIPFRHSFFEKSRTSMMKRRNQLRSIIKLEDK